jgi:large subunit ribosomal protein L25
MKESLSLAVKTRAGLGKGANRKLRAAEMVPGVYYDATGVNIPVMVEHMPLKKLYLKTASSHVFDLLIESDAGKETKPALIWQLQHHPTKSLITHVDFYGVDLTKEISVHIPVEVVGKAVGVVKGGALEVYRETIEVTCLPLAIPDKVVIDITNVDINQHVKIADISLPEGVRAVTEDNFAILGVLLPTAEEEAPAEEAEEEAAAPAAE